MKSGQRLVLEGANGLGKTTLIKAILGETSLIAHGHYWISSSINVSYLSQDFETLNGSLDAYADQAKIVRSDLLNMLHKLGLPRSAFVQPLEALSMGQKRKILLAKALCEPASLYIWDEPLNYLDVITRRQLQDLILDLKPTMLIIDHDKAFVDAIATQKIWLTKAENN